MSYVELKDIRVSYDNKNNILKDLNLSIEKGELVSLLGPSGCGKTTTLRVIAGLIEPNDGEFLVDNQNLTKVPVHKREFGMVFQSYALFPHLTIKENVAFGLKLRKEKKNSIDKKVKNILEITGLEALSDRYPKQLSGGQRQRVALARALVIEPKLLLLDEPLSNLDAKLRLSMRIEIKRIQSQLGITSVFVTHDQEECFSISDKVAVMNKGVIEQFDTPEEIYNNPKTEFVARFIGFENFFDLTQTEDWKYKAVDGTVFTSNREWEPGKGTGTIRPDDIEIAAKATQYTTNSVSGVIKVRTFLGKSYQYEVETSIGTLIANRADDVVYQVGDAVTLSIPAHKLIIV
ncbi:putative spermidine/putrescine transport system ATP-binding protein [Neobacillus niacini]|jgi:putative spermidine/putrescine transport system ATP-binding protein|uniref:ABC transporter ATP-binding protein n=1 Tax=Neobacillus niacini TaxID=86668 RepID=UPI0027803AF0|nr:ABC transporter ATP-binding protein [Neobacillus niacini]MDQ0999695.1 putative spermidine/putrescine transport system ATP-binding protein [Neobacillus niacini]